jgi:hypothetical protein
MVSSSYHLTTQINDWFFFLLAIPVVTLLLVSEYFGMVNLNLKCFDLVQILKSKQSRHAAEWLVSNHLIPKKTLKYYEDVF